MPPTAIDPMYYDGRTYYLVPDGPMGLKPYAVLLKAMTDRGCYGVGQAVFWGREQLVLVRPLAGALGLEMLHYRSQLRAPDSIASETELPSVSKEELRLAMKLIDATTASRFDIGRYEDTYTEKLKEVIAAKVEGREIASPPDVDVAPVINLMDALARALPRSAVRGRSVRNRARRARVGRDAQAGRRHAG